MVSNLDKLIDILGEMGYKPKLPYFNLEDLYAMKLDADRLKDQQDIMILEKFIQRRKND